MLDSAKQAFGTSNSNVIKGRIKNDKPWFNKDCWKQRNAFWLARRGYKAHQTKFKHDEMKNEKKMNLAHLLQF